MIELRVKQGTMVRLEEIEPEITGVAASHERGQDIMCVQLLQSQMVLGELRMDVETARMIRTALKTFSVLD